MVTVASTHLNQTSKDPLDFRQWLDAICADRSPSERRVLERVFQVLSAAVPAWTEGESPQVQQALGVANIVASLKMDTQSMAAALLFRAVVDGQPTVDTVARDFGEGVAQLLYGVIRMDAIHSVTGQLEAGKKERLKSETVRKMLLAMAEDVRVVLIKLAERTYVMRSLSAAEPQEQRRIARETMEVFAPLANRLGIWHLKWELEDLAFRYLEPELYKRIAKLLKERRIDREKYIERFIALLQEKFAEAGIRATVTGRPKHIYSIFRKMSRKGVDYHQIYDVRAARVLVKTVPECYAALGIVHTLWPYIPGEFDDYIATPKGNNYQSLHTAVIGPEGKNVEVQIRTYDMHQNSELGVAAHWRYKEGGKSHEAGFERKIAWLRQLLEWKDEVRDASELANRVDADLFEDRVYVFTPDGHVVDLPQGATPLDFAYHVHTELGHRCRGAKVNGRMVPLTYALRTGEQVEILAGKQSEPSRDWLNPDLGYLKSSKARSRIQHWFKHQNHEKNAGAGRAILERELQRLGFHEVNFESLARHFQFSKTDDFLAAVGRHDIRATQVFTALQRLYSPEEHGSGTVIPISQPRHHLQRDDVHIEGVGNLLTHFAKCCKPVPGDSIRGFITRGRGVTIHRDDCKNLLRYQYECPERLIDVAWGGRKDNVYPVEVKVTAYDRPGLLRDISSVLANDSINVLAVTTASNQKAHTATMLLTLEIGDLEKLSRALTRISQVPNVVDVRRQLS